MFLVPSNKILLYNLLLLFILSNTYAQRKFENLTIKNGLPSNKVYHTVKDSLGFLWFATDNGLCRYDGSRFTTFRNDKSDKNSIPEDVIASVFCLSKNEILVITLQEVLVIYNYQTGKFKKVEDEKTWLQNYSISSIYIDKKANYWLTTNDGLIKCDKKFNLIKEFKIPDKVKGHHLGNRVNFICEDRKGIFWLGMFYRGVVLFDPVKEIYDTKSVSSFIPHVQIGGIIASKTTDYVFIASAGEGLFKVNITDYSYTNLRNKKNLQLLPSDILTCISFQDEDNIWIGSIEGISRFNLSKNLFTNFSHNPDKPFSLVNNIVENLILDDQGILWVSTFGGISKFYTHEHRFLKINYNPTSKFSISSNKVIACYIDKSENLWLSTSNGIDIMDKELKLIHHYKIPKSHIYHENDEIVVNMIDSKNNLWTGTWGGGISRAKLPTNFKPGDKLVFKNYYYDSSDVSSLSSNFTKSISEDKKGNIWISTWNGGLNYIRNEDRNSDKIKFNRIQGKKDSSKNLASNYISEIRHDRDDNIWISTSRGLQRINFDMNQYQMYFAEEGGISNLINTSTFYIVENDNTVWSSGFQGLVKYKIDKDQKYSATIIFKDRNRGIYSMIQDETGIIWFSTVNSEIGCYNPANGKLKFYSMIDEVDGCDFYLGVPARDKNGTLFFPSYSGLLYFNPKSLFENKTIPSVYISGIQILGEEFHGESDITQVKKLELNYDQNVISINLASLNYLQSERNEYKYFLEGHDKNWHHLGTNSEINFAGLSPGSYLLKVIGSNNDGNWNYNPVVLSIYIHPPFYRNIYFLFTTSLFLGAAVIFAINRKIKRLRIEKQHQLNFSKQLIESQEAERKRLSSELHDSLGQNLLVIKNLLYIYNSTEIKNPDDMSQISDLIQESINEVKEISSNLHPHQLERLGLNKAIISIINKISKASGINIIYQLDDIKELIPPEAEINIFRIIQESLNNIVKHSKAKNVEVKIISEKSNILIIIDDDGIGVNLSEKNIQNNLTEGLGLKSINERVRLIKGKLTMVKAPIGGLRIQIEILG